MTPAQMAAIHAAAFTTPRPWTEHEIAELCDSPSVTALTSQNGFALIRRAGPEVELLTIAVAPDHRRRGEGRALLSRVLDAAQGAEEIFLEVAATNAAAIALYQQAGFAQAGHRKDYYASPKGPRVTALVMRRAL